MSRKIQVSNGEILDKYSILEIKLDKIDDEQKRKNVSKELGLLEEFFVELTSEAPVKSKYEELKTINLALWNIEDSIRHMERTKIFDSHFIELARSVYVSNDKRAKVKYEINSLTNSDIFEEKSYESY